jgi:8-oxo-dGTP pyrophosphatase MutT (NUDIX family)
MANKKTETATVDLVDIVDKDDKVLGQMNRWEAHAQGKRIRAVHIFLVNEAGEILVQWRKADKKLSPRMFTSSATGAVDAGETYAKAAVRELQEEMGVKTKITKLGTYQLNKGLLVNGELFVGKWDGEVSGWEDEADGIDYWSRDVAEFMLARFPYLLTE